MKKLIFYFLLLVFFSITSYQYSMAQFVLESLDGPVTQNEINAFKTWAQGINVPSNWAPTSNQMSYGSEGRKCEALGLMYELTKDKAMLDGLIKFADGLLKRRNNPVTGTFEWTGERELIWLPEEIRSGAEQGLIESKILYAAQLILQSPTLWDQVIPTNPNGYGATYRQRALKYVEEMEKTESTYLFKWYVRASDKHLIFPDDPRSDAGTHGGEMPFNQKWMLMFGKMRMAKCYELLGNATMAKKYKDVVQANLSLYASQMYPRTYQGLDAYIWYYPTNNQVYTEDIGHAQHGIIGMMNLDLLGGYTSMPDRVKMGNAILYANYRASDNQWNHNVAGTNATWYRKIQPGFLFLSRYVPTLYKTIGDDLIKEDVVTDQYDATAYILWAKNARYTNNWGVPNTKPTVSITSPSNNATFTAPANIAINANASDAVPGIVAKVDFYRGTTLIGTDNTSPYTITWAGAAAGTYSLTAKATDNTGAVTTSSAISVIVNAPINQLPSVSITSPANNATFTAPANFTIAASASDADGSVTRVEFYRGTTKLGEDVVSPFSFSVTGLAAGTYSLTARAVDNVGAATTSSVISVTVNAPPVCQAASASADDGNVATNVLDGDLATRWSASGDGQWIQFCLDAEKNVNGVQIAFYNGNSRVYSFDILHSLNGTSWTTSVGGLTSSGTSLALETFTFTAATAKYIRIVGHGNSSNAWNSFTEVKINEVVSTGVVTVYKNCNYSTTGYEVSLSVGNYTTSQLIALGVSDNDVSSLQVSSGYEALLYNENNFQGTPLVLNADVSCLTGNSFNDLASSVIVRAATINNAPSVSINYPSNNTSYTAPASFTITATATDTDGTISKVEFYRGTTKLGEDVTSPYSFAVTGLAAGTYSLTARATDDAGVVTTSSAVNITVNAPQNQVPTVSITAPLHNTSYTAPASFTITASASDADGSVTKVEFYRGTTKIGEEAVIPYRFSVTGLAAGTYSFTARATDNLGAVTISVAISITVQASTNTCSGIAQYTENGGYAAGNKVQNSGNQYQCKPYPYSGWCNGAAWAYAPGTGSYWQDAWTLIGSCSTARTSATTSGAALLTSVPNPFGSTTTITVIVETAGETSVIVYDQMGREVAVLVNGNLSADTYKFMLDASDLKPGMYVCRFINSGEVISSLIVKQ